MTFRYLPMTRPFVGLPVFAYGIEDARHEDKSNGT